MPRSALSLRGRGHELVHAAVAVRHGQNVLHPRQQVVRIQHGVFGDPPQAVRPVRADVAVHADQHADVAEEAPHPADRLGPVVVEVVAAAVLDHDRHGQERGEPLGHGDRARAGSAAAVRAAEGLVRVEVHQVGAEIAGPGDAQDGVHVGPVEIDQPAGVVDHPGDLLDPRLEQPERVRIGNHEHGRLGR